MSDGRFTVRFLSTGRSGAAPAGVSLHEAVRRLGHVIDHACGGNALCGTCCVLVVEGEDHLTPPSPEERLRLRELALDPPYRLACQARLTGEGGEVTIVAC